MESNLELNATRREKSASACFGTTSGGWVSTTRLWSRSRRPHSPTTGKREFFTDNLLVRMLFIIEVILVDRPCAMGVSTPLSKQPYIYLPSNILQFEGREGWYFSPFGTSSELLCSNLVCRILKFTGCTEVPRSSETSPPWDPTVRVCLGPDGGPKRGGCFL